MDQEIDYVTSCYGDESLDYVKYAEQPQNLFFECEERGCQYNSATHSTQNRSASSSMSDSLNSNASFISNKLANSIQEVEIKASFNEFNQINNNSNSIIPLKKEAAETSLKNVQFNFENIALNISESNIAFLHGEIPIQKQSIYNGLSDCEFMKSDSLQQYKQVNSLVQTNNFLHIELTSVVQSNPSEISSIFTQWEQEKIAEKAWNNQQSINNSEIIEGDYYNQSFDFTLFVSQYISTITNQQSYFYQNQYLVDLFSQNYQSQERYDNINKRAFKILKKLQSSSKTQVYTYKIVRKTPFEYSTLSRGVSNSFFDKLGLDKQEVSQYIMRSHSLPFSCEINQQERIKLSIEEILTHNSFLQQNKRHFQRTFQNGDVSFNTLIEQQIYPLNDQLGNEMIDINDYLIVDVMMLDEKQSVHFAQKMRERKQQFGYCFASSDFHYKTMSSNIVEKYYQNYSEQQRQENQIIRLLNKKNHRFH